MSYNRSHPKARQPYHHMMNGRPYPAMPRVPVKMNGHRGHVTTPAAREEEFVLPTFRGNEPPNPNPNPNPNVGTPHQSSSMYSGAENNKQASNKSDSPNANDNEVAVELPASLIKRPTPPPAPTPSPAATMFGRGPAPQRKAQHAYPSTN